MARKKTPQQTRARVVRARRLGLGSALAEIQERFQSPESRDAFGNWRRDPVTLMMLDALREIARTPPVGYIDTDEIGVQFGVSSGVDLAAAFLDDPSVLYPHLFTGAAPGSAEPLPSDYAADPLSSAAESPAR